MALLLRAIRAASSTFIGGAGAPPFLSANASLSVMSLLEPNLASSSRLLRLSTARVLAQYDPIWFGDSTGAGVRASKPSQTVPQQSQEGPCGFLGVVEALETLPISIAAERDFMWRLGQLEVMGRSNRLPRPYARLMATHALGLLRVKFSGVWPRAIAVIGALCQRPSQRVLVWEAMHKALRRVMPPPPTRGQVRPTPGLQRTTEAMEGERKASSEMKILSKTEEASVVGSPYNGLAKGPTQQEEVGASQCPSGLRTPVPPPQPWVPRLVTHAATLDAGPTEEMDLPVALQGVFLDDAVRTGLQPESGEVPLWASTDDDSAFAQVQ